MDWIWDILEKYTKKLSIHGSERLYNHKLLQDASNNTSDMIFKIVLSIALIKLQIKINNKKDKEIELLTF